MLLYTLGDAIRILRLYGKLNRDLELQMAKSLLACHKMKEPHLDWMNWKVHKSLEVATIRILISYGNKYLELQMAKSLLACHKMKESHLDWTNWKVYKS